jgi:hypothetical protein
LLERVASLLARARGMKPQTLRQLEPYLAEHASASVGDFLLCAASLLEDHELDILFGPIFTPTLDERAEVADLLFHWRPSVGEVSELVTALCASLPHATVVLADDSRAKLTLHEVMVERFVRLLRLDAAPEAPDAAAMRDALPVELWRIAVALMCERGMTPAKQTWFAGFVNHMSSRHPVDRGALETAAAFVAGQNDLDHAKLLAAAEALARATEGTAAYAAGWHAYWSPDVAQHHHYRGQGTVDRERLEQQQTELRHVAVMVEDLRSFSALSSGEREDRG